MTDPAKYAQIMKAAVEKEFRSWVSPYALAKAARGNVETEETSAAYYRVPLPGEPVTVTGMRRRPELNGACGEIMNSSLDEHGRVTVRVWDSSTPGQGGSRRMKIQPFRLVPMKASGAGGGASQAMDDGRSSARSMSRTGSLASRPLSQAGSAISFGRQSAMSLPRSGEPGLTPPPSAQLRHSQSDPMLRRGTPAPSGQSGSRAF
jgi:hypothetical protein